MKNAKDAKAAKKEKTQMGIIENRRSVREFAEKSIDKETLLRIVNAGMQAPCAYGRSGAEFLILTNPDDIKKAAEVNPNAKPAENAAALIITLYNSKDDKKKNDWWVEDMSAVTENILLKITEEDLGGVWLGIYPREDRSEYLKKAFGVPENVTPFSLIALGYPKTAMGEKERRSLPVYFGGYGKK